MRASYIGCIGTHAYGYHCYVKVTSSCEIVSLRIQGLLEAYFKIKKTVVSKKKNPLFV